MNKRDSNSTKTGTIDSITDHQCCESMIWRRKKITVFRKTEATIKKITNLRAEGTEDREMGDEGFDY